MRGNFFLSVEKGLNNDDDAGNYYKNVHKLIHETFINSLSNEETCIVCVGVGVCICMYMKGARGRTFFFSWVDWILNFDSWFFLCVKHHILAGKLKMYIYALKTMNNYQFSSLIYFLTIMKTSVKLTNLFLSFLQDFLLILKQMLQN